MAKKEAQKTPTRALYRTYRPQRFKDVVGQDHVVSVLEAAVQKGSIAHAYLFAGSRGTGKTSIARIMARELGVAERDIYEMDAASNRGIDDIREIRDGVPVLPFESPYKVYIIDEAHALTKDAWNALLKTLEEPPAHVIFIFATTELHKVPDTIRSRAETYQFRQPTRELLAKTVRSVAKAEGYSLEQSAAELIATLAEGSFRDALSLLQKVLTLSSQSTIELSAVEQVAGAPTARVLHDAVHALATRNTQGALAAVRTAAEHNADMRVFTKLLMHRLRIVLLARHALDVAELTRHEYGEEEFAALVALGKDKECAITSHTLRAFLTAYEHMAFAALPHLPLELAILEVSAPGTR